MNKRKHSMSGSCHCGSIGYTLHTDMSLDAITLRICRCDFCLRHRPRYWSDPQGELRVQLSQPANVQRYRFGHGTADFVVCRNCGVFAFAVTEINGKLFAVINLNLVLDKDVVLPEAFIEALAETEVERNARRSRNWTPVTSGWRQGERS